MIPAILGLAGLAFGGNAAAVLLDRRGRNHAAEVAAWVAALAGFAAFVLCVVGGVRAWQS